MVADFLRGSAPVSNYVRFVLRFGSASWVRFGSSLFGMGRTFVRFGCGRTFVRLWLSRTFVRRTFVRWNVVLERCFIERLFVERLFGRVRVGPPSPLVGIMFDPPPTPPSTPPLTFCVGVVPYVTMRGVSHEGICSCSYL